MIEELKKVFGEIEEVEGVKELPNFVKRIKDCGKKVLARRCKDCGTVYYYGIHCHHRLCPECARKRHIELFKKFKEVVKRWKWVSHVVLTLRVDEDLGKSIDLIKRGYNKIRRKFKIRKYLYGVEIIKKEKGWYVHLHSLVNKRWIAQRELSEVWKQITGGSYVVWVKRVGDREKAVLEVLKYCLKGIRSLSEEDIEYVGRAIYGKRLIGVNKNFSSLDNIEIIEPLFFKECPKCGGELVYFGVFTRDEVKNFKIFGVYEAYEVGFYDTS